jgi:hypothetical protein
MLTGSPPSSRILQTAALAAIFTIAAPCFGQDTSDQTPHPFALGTWGGDSPVAGTEVYDLRIPASFKVFTSDRDDWGLRVRLVLYAGIYDFNLDEAIDLDLRFQSLAATPGVEFLVPVGKGWILKPFAEIGYGHDFDNDLGFGVWSVGMRTIVTWPVKTWYLSFGTKFQYLSTFTADLAFADDYGEIRLGFDARHPLPFTIGGNQADISGYYIRRQWVDAFIAKEDIDPLEILYTNELGFTFGTTPKVKLWFIPLPRIGLGYRWGPHIKGIRLNFGFPF